MDGESVGTIYIENTELRERLFVCLLWKVVKDEWRWGGEGVKSTGV